MIGVGYDGVCQLRDCPSSLDQSRDAVRFITGDEGSHWAVLDESYCNSSIASVNVKIVAGGISISGCFFGKRSG